MAKAAGGADEEQDVSRLLFPEGVSMQFREDHRTFGWSRKALCRRYALVHFADFQVSDQENGVPRCQSWCWAFAMFAADEFEILGAWRADIFAFEHIVDDIWDRGVLSIRVVSIAEAKGCASPLSPESWAAILRGAKPRVLAVVASQAISGDAIEGVPSPAIRSARNSAGRIHDRLVRGARLRAPFASAAAASEFVANWLERADRRLYEARRPTQSVVARAA
jgi:hypothetical protein